MLRPHRPVPQRQPIGGHCFRLEPHAEISVHKRIRASALRRIREWGPASSKDVAAKACSPALKLCIGKRAEIDAVGVECHRTDHRDLALNRADRDRGRRRGSGGELGATLVGEVSGSLMQVGAKKLTQKRLGPVGLARVWQRSQQASRTSVT